MSRVLLAAATAFLLNFGAAAAQSEVVIVTGNNTGTYAAPGITSANRLLLGIAVQDTLATTGYNYSPSPFALVGTTINPSAGWTTSAGAITDPDDVDWTGYSIIWLYQ